jgi:hypothetical protein
LYWDRLRTSGAEDGGPSIDERAPRARLGGRRFSLARGLLILGAMTRGHAFVMLAVALTACGGGGEPGTPPTDAGAAPTDWTSAFAGTWQPISGRASFSCSDGTNGQSGFDPSARLTLSETSARHLSLDAASLDAGTGCTTTYTVDGLTASLSPGDQFCTVSGPDNASEEVTSWTSNVFSLVTAADGSVQLTWNVRSVVSLQYGMTGITARACSSLGTFGLARSQPMDAGTPD